MFTDGTSLTVYDAILRGEMLTDGIITSYGYVWKNVCEQALCDGI